VRLVSESGIPTYFLHLEEDKLVLFDTALLGEIQKLDSSSSRLIDIIHSDKRVQALVRQNHMWAWDETVALYLEEPSLGTMKKIQGDFPLFTLSEWDRDAVRKNYVRLASGLTVKELSPRMPVVMMKYPTNPKDLREDVRILIPDAITRHGLEEWKATLLTNELHRHLGIYSIIGAKMGIRARELLGASLDEVGVESYAGSKPPLSCMNDGLQVSTGASLGRGTITILEGEPRPAAAFIHGDRTLHLSVKEEVVEKIRADIRKTIKQYGALTPEYFKEIRRLSIRYWLKLDRREIFDQRIESKVSSDQAGRVTK
jgi:pyrimidine-specific ribonucleoside hydrolase